jgi:perosamine synthetase
VNNEDFIPVNEPLLTGNEERYVRECIATGWISSEGPFVAEFEDKFSSAVGREYGVAVTNGTTAIDAAVEALGIAPGDEVILPAFTIISCVLQIVRSGARPVLVDSDPVTWNMDVNRVAEKITPRTKAIMAVHIYGLPVDLEPLQQLAKDHGLAIIEDAAEAIGQTYYGKPCGSFGDVSTFSFYPNKHITTGEGGMIVTNREEISETCKSLRNLCFKAENRFVHERLGWNMRMTNIQAAIGLAQLERLEETVARKRQIGEKYSSLLSDLQSLRLPITETIYAKNIYWVYGVVLDSARGIAAKKLIKSLGVMGIGTRPFFCPMHRQPVLLDMGLFKGESYPIAEDLYEFGFYLPSGVALQDNQIDKVVTAMKALSL